MPSSARKGVCCSCHLSVTHKVSQQPAAQFFSNRTLSKNKGTQCLQEVVGGHAEHLGAQLLHGRCRPVRGQPAVLLPAQAAVGNSAGPVCCSSHCDASCL